MAFYNDGEEIVNQIKTSWETFEMFGLWIYESCHRHDTPNFDIDPAKDIAGHLGFCSREEFRNLYEFILSQGLEFTSAQFVRNVTHEYRGYIQQEAEEYYKRYYPYVDYQGITQSVPKSNGTGFNTIPRPAAEFYLPVHYVEPVRGNEKVIELDKLTAAGRNATLQAMISRMPVLTGRIKLVQETDIGHNTA